MIITGGSLSESKQALKLAREQNMFATIGCHPTRSNEFDKYRGGPEAYLKALDDLIARNLKGPGRVVAVGECGLDYDRLFFADAETQRKHFKSQLSLAKKHHLPLFLHSRAAHADLVRILKEEGFGEDGGKAVGGRGGVVHSHTGPKEEVDELVAMGFHISINGCGLKTDENLTASAAIPLDKLILETDAPWCTLTSTHASKQHLNNLPPNLSSLYFPRSNRPERFVLGEAVKGRNEPCAIGAVAWVLARLQNQDFLVLTEKAWKNTVEVFGLDEAELEEKVEKKEPQPEFDASKVDWPALG
jgi:TatD DNase family protein